MRIIRDYIESIYGSERDKLFINTAHDPEIAHELLVKRAAQISRFGLDNIIFGCPENDLVSKEISNAAGFNKGAYISPRFLKALGFNRVVVGTVTYEPWEGNARPRIKRYPHSDSIVNWMGLPGQGAEKVADNLRAYGNHGVPLTINVMATPQSTDPYSDVKKSIRATRGLPYVDRFELNISCPNTHSHAGSIDARAQHLQQLEPLLDAFMQTIGQNQEAYVKVSPDLTDEQVETITQASLKYGIKGIVTTNTTTKHDNRYITFPPNEKGNGGASGAAVYDSSTRVQKQFSKLVSGHNMLIVACGGIDSAEKAQERMSIPNTQGIQVFTPLIFKGPALIRDLRRCLSI